jgi:hypothetical protein
MILASRLSSQPSPVNEHKERRIEKEWRMYDNLYFLVKFEKSAKL